MNKTESNEKILELMNKYNLFEKEIKLFKELMFQCDLKQQNKYGWTPLMYALMFNKEQNLKLTIRQFKTMYSHLSEEQKQITFKNFLEMIEKRDVFFESNQDIKKIDFHKNKI